MLQFFPRGENIVTRMPIKLKLCHQSEEGMKIFCQKNNLEYLEKSTYIRYFLNQKKKLLLRLKYDGIDGSQDWSPFFNVNEIEKAIKDYMDKAVQCKMVYEKKIIIIYFFFYRKSSRFCV